MSEERRGLRAGANTAISDLMRFRDSAAATLAAWILVAPSVECARRGLQLQTPISEWDNVDSVSSQEDCENYRQVVIAAEKTDSENTIDRYSYSICLPADDPRLKEQ